MYFIMILIIYFQILYFIICSFWSESFILKESNLRKSDRKKSHSTGIKLGWQPPRNNNCPTLWKKAPPLQSCRKNFKWQSEGQADLNA